MIGLNTKELERVLFGWIAQQSKLMPDMIRYLPAGERPAEEEHGSLLLQTPSANYVIPSNATGFVSLRVLPILINENNRRITEQLKTLGFDV